MQLKVLSNLPEISATTMALEAKTIRAMVRIYCKGHHQTGALCASCKSMQAYCLERLEQCVFQHAKTTCAKCPVHCYAPIQREATREMMRYSGPRMIWRHPYLAMRHVWHGRSREVPAGWPNAYPKLHRQVQRQSSQSVN